MRILNVIRRFLKRHAHGGTEGRVEAHEHRWEPVRVRARCSFCGRPVATLYRCAVCGAEEARWEPGSRAVVARAALTGAPRIEVVMCGDCVRESRELMRRLDERLSRIARRVDACPPSARPVVVDSVEDLVKYLEGRALAVSRVFEAEAYSEWWVTRGLGVCAEVERPGSTVLIVVPWWALPIRRRGGPAWDDGDGRGAGDTEDRLQAPRRLAADRLRPQGKG